MENSVLSHHLAAEPQATLAIRRVLLELGRLLRPQAEALDKLARESSTVGQEAERPYLREAYSDMTHASEVVGTLRDRMDGVINVHLAVASNRVNEIVKVLTLFTALFLPITFLTGFFGMNFPFLPMQQPAVFVGTLVLMLVCPVAMWLWFWRRGWL
jgi:magnesium transporter